MSKLVGHGRPDFSAQYKQPENLCTTCDGTGYTKDTRARVYKNKTQERGSGCPDCKGLGTKA